jgi:RHS repeat-associated protein
LIDELRVYPYDAQMNSASYNLDGTMRNECDVNNFVSTLLYDEWRRPEWKLDDRLQILSKTTYHDRDLSNPSDRSWMSEAVVLEQGMTASEILNANPSDPRLRVTKQYYDGFGRNIQTLAVRQSGNSANDLVSFHVFDGIGREARAYLPFASQNNNNGNYIENPVGLQSQFYQSELYVAHTDFPFSETVFENSPLNRVLEQGNVGEAWQIGSEHTTRVRHLFNDPNEVLLWQPTEAGGSAMNSGAVVYYPENSLQKKLVVNESGASFWEFTDVYGKLICKRTFALMSGSIDSPSFNHLGTGRISDNNTATPLGGGPTLRRLDVYFVYDDFGNLIYEIPAIASLAMGANQQFSALAGGVNYGIFDGYMTSSRFDKFGNVIAKKKPGEGWSFYVYNKLGQVVLSKSPSQSAAGNQWNFVKYDKLGRPIQTGTYTSTSTREQLQTLAYYGAIVSEDRTGNISNVYTNETFPNTNLEILTETFYDNYDFDINGFTYSFATTVPVAQSKRTKGITTGSRVKVLDGTNNFLVSVSYYDVFGRSAVQFSENILGGLDKITNLYDYTGALTESRRYFKRNSGASEGIHVVNKFEYDHAGRPTITKQKINNDEEIVLSKLIYNALGQVVKKHLHIAGAANTGMQVVDYRYNERGWLKKINNADLSNDGDNLESWDVFGQEIIYNDVENYYSNTMQAIAQFGGNISAVKWKTNVTGEDPNQMGGHSYVFRYDDLGQMTGAYYAASHDDFIDNYNTRMNHWDERVSYDSNGNIISMYRSRGKNEEGIVLPTNALNPINMDILTYNYFEHSNKLKSISDAASTGWISNTFSNPFSHFVDGNTSATDYFYDQEGRLTKDENKGLEFSYNHLDLLEKAKYGTEEVKFIWDATGVKLAKQVGSNITYYFGGIEYTNNTITHLETSEGIARPASGTANSSEWHYDYYLKDHLGNVRAVITEENSELESERVTVELARRMLEDASFDNVTATEKDKPYLYPYDPADPNNQKVSELSKLTGKIIGPAKVIAVKKGEKVDLSTKYWYTEAPGAPLTDLTEILAGTLFNLGMASAGIIPNGPEAGMALLNNVSGDQFGNLSNFLANSFNDIDLQKPRAYIVYMSFDKNMMLDPRNSGKIQVTDANTLGQLSKQDIIFRTDGYFYVYVTNQSETHVNFDNLIIRRWKPKVRVTYNYYPFGLTWENPKLPGTEEGLHDHTYQDKEFQFAEFSDGRGLELHDFHARMYDATTGRWLVPDPAAQFANPYLAMGNSPMVSIDPDGRVVVTAMVVGAIIGAYIGGTMTNDSMNPIEWDYNDPETLSHMFAGAVIGAAIGYGFAHGMGSITISPDYRLGTEQVGAGFNVTAGVGIGPFTLGMRVGVTHYSSSWSGTSGTEFRTGFTLGIGKDPNFGSGNWFQYNVTRFESGETSQTTANARIGKESGFHFRYENDQMPFADKGDRFRTAAQQLGYGKFNMGVTMFTGDPDAKFGDEWRPSEKIDGKDYYYSKNGSDPDKYRAGIGYFGFGNFKIGINSERIRHTIQNVLVHDTIGVPRFRQMPEEHPNTFHFSFGSSSYTLY